MSNLGYERGNPRVERIMLTGIMRHHESGELAENSIGRTLNISEGGILLEVVEHAPFLAKVSLSIALNEYILNVEGEVVHLRKSQDGKVEMGIRFIDPSEKDAEMLKMFIL